jgi:hypothetical protein
MSCGRVTTWRGIDDMNVDAGTTRINTERF